MEGRTVVVLPEESVGSKRLIEEPNNLDSLPPEILGEVYLFLRVEEQMAVSQTSRILHFNSHTILKMWYDRYQRHFPHLYKDKLVSKVSDIFYWRFQFTQASRSEYGSLPEDLARLFPLAKEGDEWLKKVITPGNFRVLGTRDARGVALIGWLKMSGNQALFNYFNDIAINNPSYCEWAKSNPTEAEITLMQWAILGCLPVNYIDALITKNASLDRQWKAVWDTTWSTVKTTGLHPKSYWFPDLTETFLIIAIRGGQSDIVTHLLDRGIGVSEGFGEELVCAIMSGHENVVASLVKHAAKRQIKISQAAMRAAVGLRRKDIVKILCDNGEEIDGLYLQKYTGSMIGWAVSTFLLRACFECEVETVEFLIECGANVDEKRNGFTVLQMTALQMMEEHVWRDKDEKYHRIINILRSHRQKHAKIFVNKALENLSLIADYYSFREETKELSQYLHQLIQTLALARLGIPENDTEFYPAVKAILKIFTIKDDAGHLVNLYDIKSGQFGTLCIDYNESSNVLDGVRALVKFGDKMEGYPNFIGVAVFMLAVLSTLTLIAALIAVIPPLALAIPAIGVAVTAISTATGVSAAVVTTVAAGSAAVVSGAAITSLRSGLFGRHGKSKEMCDVVRAMMQVERCVRTQKGSR